MGGPTNQHPRESATIQIRSERSEIDRAAAQVLDAMGRLGYPDQAQFAVRLAMEEALSNAVRHGHKNLDPSVPVTLDFRADTRSIVITVEDRGPGFNPQSVPDPTLDENLELPTGRGLLLMRAYMSSVEHNPSGNRVTMTYLSPDAAPTPAPGRAGR